jgi:hypothetical protein
MLGKHKQVQPLTLREMEAFDRALEPPANPFQAYLGKEIFTVPLVPSSHQALGVAGFVTGGLGGLVTYYLAMDLMKIFGASAQVGSFVGVIVLIPRIALGGNALQDCVLKALHDYYQSAKLPQKNNQKILRKMSEGFVYVSSAALAVMSGYILWTNLPYSRALRGFLLPSILLGSGVVNIRPFLDANENLFAKYSSGKTLQVREKRAALIEGLNTALNEIRAYDANQFDEFFKSMTARSESPQEIQARWEKLLELAENPTQAAPLPKSTATKLRGGFGWLLSLLSSLTNIQISYAEAKWIAESYDIDDKNFVPALALISSVLCVVAYAVLCAGPTQTVFEHQAVKQGWEASHPWLRKASVFFAALFGFASAIPNASWPIVLGATDYEKSLAGPAFISPGSLYMSACLILLNRLIDSYDRWAGQSSVVDHMDFLARLQSLTRALAQLPDETIDQLIPLEHPLLTRYHASRGVSRLPSQENLCTQGRREIGLC